MTGRNRARARVGLVARPPLPSSFSNFCGLRCPLPAAHCGLSGQPYLGTRHGARTATSGPLREEPTAGVCLTLPCRPSARSQGNESRARALPLVCTQRAVKGRTRGNSWLKATQSALGGLTDPPVGGVDRWFAGNFRVLLADDTQREKEMADQHKARHDGDADPVPRDMPDQQRDDGDSPRTRSSGETTEEGAKAADEVGTDRQGASQQMGVASDQPDPDEPTD